MSNIIEIVTKLFLMVMKKLLRMQNTSGLFLMQYKGLLNLQVVNIN